MGGDIGSLPPLTLPLPGPKPRMRKEDGWLARFLRSNKGRSVAQGLNAIGFRSHTQGLRPRKVCVMSKNNVELQAQLDALIAENQALKAKAAARSKITLKVSEKGAVSIYGVGRFPVTLYKSQAERIFSDETVAMVREFITAHPELKTKE